MTMVLSRQQHPDGAWGFAAPRAPMQSSYFTYTALAIKCLGAYSPNTYSAEVAKRIEHAKRWLQKTPAKDNEDRVFRLLGLKWADANSEAIQKSVAELIAAQRRDGGWSQLPDLQSDAYATGEALYALHAAGGLATTDPVYQRGIQFLLRTQDDDGSWFVSKRADPVNNYFNAGFPHGQSQYSSFNGTCWATMALLETIDRPGQVSSAK
jgi:squalene cyclase